MNIGWMSSVCVFVVLNHVSYLTAYTQCRFCLGIEFKLSLSFNFESTHYIIAECFAHVFTLSVTHNGAPSANFKSFSCLKSYKKVEQLDIVC